MADDNVEINIEAKATLDTSEFDAGLSSISAQSKKINDEQKKSAGGILKTNTANSKIGGVGPQRALQRIYQQQNRQLQQQVRLVQQLAQNWQQIAQNAQQAQQAQQGGGGGGRPGRGRGGRQGGGGGGMGAALSALGGPLKFIGTKLISAISSVLLSPFYSVSSDYQAYQQYAASRTQMSGLMGTSRFGARGLTANRLDQYKTDFASRLGFTSRETMDMARQVVRATGSDDGLTAVANLSRNTGLSAGELTAPMREIRSAGFQSGQNTRELQRIFSYAVTAGVDASQLPQFLGGVQSLLHDINSKTAGRNSTEGWSQLLATMHQSGQAGLQGERGASVAQNVFAGLRSVASNPQSEAFQIVAGALGYGTPGGNTSYEQVLETIQTLGQGREVPLDVLRRIFSYTDSIYGSQGASNVALTSSLMSSSTISQIRALREVAMGDAAHASNASALFRSGPADGSEDSVVIADAIHNAQMQAAAEAAGQQYASPLQQMSEIFREIRDVMVGPIAQALQIVADTIRSIYRGLYDWGIIRTQGNTRETTEFVREQMARVSNTTYEEGMTPAQVAEASAPLREVYERLQTRRGQRDLRATTQIEDINALTPTQLRTQMGQIYNPDRENPTEDQQIFSNTIRMNKTFAEELIALADAMGIRRDAQGQERTIQQLMSLIRDANVTQDEARTRERVEAMTVAVGGGR